MQSWQKRLRQKLTVLVRKTRNLNTWLDGQVGNKEILWP